jgi:hypothetical protein
MLILLVCSTLPWISCGGGNGGGGDNPPPPPVTITISPSSSTLAGGGTQQFTATVGNTTNTAVTWEVGGITGGNASLGTISASGLYTAPLVIPAGGMVTVRAVAQADTSKSASATVTITFSNAMLNGRYAISFVGYDPSFLIFGGSVTFSGTGSIPDGVADLNDSVDVFSGLTVTGTYAVTADGRVEIMLTDSGGRDYTLRAVIVSPDRLRMIRFDSDTTFPPSGAAGQGIIERQDPAAFANTALSGGFAFRLDGPGPSGCIAGIAGRMTADGAGVLSQGVMDVNECGFVDNAVAFDGVYDISSATGRGTATLNTTLGVFDFAVYTVSASRIHLVSIDLDLVPWNLGVAEKQSKASFANADLTGNYAFFLNGASPGGTYFAAGRFTTDGSGAVSAGLWDENNDNVTEENVAFSGNYAVSANGRATASLTSTFGTLNYNVYLVSPTRAFFMQENDVSLGTGELDAQSGSLSTAAVSGDYGFSLDGFPAMIVGRMNAAAGTASGTSDTNFFDDVNSVFVPTPGEAFTATYTVAPTGRGDFTVPDPVTPQTLHIYVVSPSKLHIIGITSQFLGSAEKQF